MSKLSRFNRRSRRCPVLRCCFRCRRRAGCRHFNAERWTAWLDDQLPDSLPMQVWQALQPLNLALGGESAYRQYLPCSVVRLPVQPLAALTAGQADRDQLLISGNRERKIFP
ncbi:hypothetical protein [Polaromonas naphthalenivorans]|uniref:hypothetical protein n=1 Tax=Polaromonas naphthalenivorans TaxID=216465 RepID=UPI0012ECFE70|nr:hypothetical protein [Polaromonas naphthalenivorans]